MRYLLFVFLLLPACGPSINDSSIGNSANIVPSLIKEVADQPPKFSPSYKIVRGTFTDQFDIVENHKVGSYSLARDPSGNTDDIVERFISMEKNVVAPIVNLGRLGPCLGRMVARVIEKRKRGILSKFLSLKTFLLDRNSKEDFIYFQNLKKF